MRVMVHGRAVDLSPADVLGQGGEAMVYRSGDRAIKLFQGLSPDALAAKAEKVRTYPRTVPAEVIAPLAPAYDTKGMFVGYAMRLLDGAQDGQRLASKRHRGGVLGAAEVTGWLQALAKLLDALHHEGIIAGDLNDGNVLYAEKTAWIIDADSHQFGGQTCTVAHEKYLDPKLYGVDLGATGALSIESDWYAFAVLAFSVWLYTHPYGGVHPTIGTLARRAEARTSVLRPEVVRPKSATSPDVLPDRLVAWFQRVFDGELRERMPPSLLDLTWSTCACGLEHARLACPSCAKGGVIRARAVIARHGRIRATVVFAGRRVLVAKARGGSVEYLAQRTDGEWVRDDGTFVPVRLGGRVALGGRRTLIADGPTIVTVEGGVVVERRRAGTLAMEAMFDAHGARSVRLDGDYLVDALEGARIGSILEGATAVAIGESIGFGYYRAGRVTQHFTWRHGRAGLTEVLLPTISGRLLSHRVYFDGERALIAWHEESGGVERAHLHLIDLRGNVLASLVGRPESSPLLASTSGFALTGGRIVRATERGVVSVEVFGRALLAGSLFVDAEPFVHEGCELLAGPGGSLYVVTEDRITQLCLEGA